MLHSNPIACLSMGAFGAAASKYLQLLCPDSLMVEPLSEGSIPAVKLANCRAAVLFTEQLPPRVCEQLNDLAHQNQQVFLPVSLGASTLTIGPVVLPGMGACWQCWEQRSKQHARHIGQAEQSADSGLEAISLSSQRLLYPCALIAACEVLWMCQDVQRLRAVAGSVWRMDLGTHDVSTSTTVGVHDCKYCGLERPAETRGFAQMSEALQSHWLS